MCEYLIYYIQQNTNLADKFESINCEIKELYKNKIKSRFHLSCLKSSDDKSCWFIFMAGYY